MRIESRRTHTLLQMHGTEGTKARTEKIRPNEREKNRKYKSFHLSNLPRRRDGRRDGTFVKINSLHFSPVPEAAPLGSIVSSETKFRLIWFRVLKMD